MNDVQIVWRRWQDLDDRSVIRWNGNWHEVLQVYRTREELAGEWADESGSLPGTVRVWGGAHASLAVFADKAFDRAGSDYVIVRLYDEARSRDEVEDWWMTEYRLGLVETQSLAAYPRKPQSLDPRAGDRELARHPGLVDEYHALRAVLDANGLVTTHGTQWCFADGLLTHGTIEYETDHGRFRIRLQELDEHGGAPE